jgi:hypothetical protein
MNWLYDSAFQKRLQKFLFVPGRLHLFTLENLEKVGGFAEAGARGGRRQQIGIMHGKLPIENPRMTMRFSSMG